MDRGGSVSERHRQPRPAPTGLFAGRAHASPPKKNSSPFTPVHTIVPGWSQKRSLCRGIFAMTDKDKRGATMTLDTPPIHMTPITRADMHCHSTASQISKLGVQRALGLPECATPPQEVYELAKRRGMDFVTITDHDTIDGVLEISDRPDVFISEELTTHFRGEPQAVHVLCYGITSEDHEWLQANSRRRRALRRLPLRAGDRMRASPPLLQRWRPPHRPPPPAPSRALQCLGDPQRRARTRAEPASRDLRRHPQRNRHRRLRRSRRG